MTYDLGKLMLDGTHRTGGWAYYSLHGELGGMVEAVVSERQEGVSGIPYVSML